MMRSISAVVASYLAMLLLAFIGFSCAYRIVGSEVAFKPLIFEASTLWIRIAFLINIVVAIIGGFLCAFIAKGGRSPLALAVLAVVLGLAVAVADRNKGKANAGMVRPANPPIMEAVQKAYWPVWVPFAFPFTSAIGILIGGNVRRRP